MGRGGGEVKCSSIPFPSYIPFLPDFLFTPGRRSEVIRSKYNEKYGLKYSLHLKTNLVMIVLLSQQSIKSICSFDVSLVHFTMVR